MVIFNFLYCWLRRLYRLYIMWRYNVYILHRQ